ncbi:MAG: IMP dehydrogenase [Coriobacteriia bacterium]|nr:IMP dehydrogenase [Coriobacteriia bacterium]MCL2870566.1 IMP dehydrogenase [Coriobacteriia bacterium]
MARFVNEPSRTFNEYLLIPSFSGRDCTAANVSLKTPLVKYRVGETPDLSLNIPLTSAIMQSVSGDRMAIALAKEGGISFIFGAQSIEDQAAMVARVKDHKSGFVRSDSNVGPDATLSDILEMRERTGHSTVAVTEDGTSQGKLIGIVTGRDYRVSRMSPDDKVADFMTSRDDLVCGFDGMTISQANDMIWDNKLNALPVLDNQDRLTHFVFRKDYDSHKSNPSAVVDTNKSYLVGAGINTHDYRERIPALVDAGVDVLCIDSSEGHSIWQADTIAFVRDNYGDKVKIGAGNVVDAEGFRYLADAGADFVKVGIGGGSICITREQKGIGRGQASAVVDVAAARDQYAEETGVYVPLCSDGGIVFDYHMTLALAMGADFLMLGRYFARFDESPTPRINYNGAYVKEYWGEGSNRARNWQRYGEGEEGTASKDKSKLTFEEGVDSYVPYAGNLKDNVSTSLAKVKSTMANCGVLDIASLQKEAKITLVSATSIVEGGAHDVILRNQSRDMR